MVRLRNAVMVLVLATGLAGCSFAHWSPPPIAHWSPFHCDTCDDFPMPEYGQNKSMTLGSYTGPPTPGMSGAARPDAAAPPSGAMPGMSAPATPPATPPATSDTPPATPNP
jgi:hypothetical protein